MLGLFSSLSVWSSPQPFTTIILVPNCFVSLTMAVCKSNLHLNGILPNVNNNGGSPALMKSLRSVVSSVDEVPNQNPVNFERGGKSFGTDKK